LGIAVVTAVHPSHPAEFAEVEAEVRKHLSEVKAVELVNERSKKAADLLKQNGGDIKAAAKAVGLSVQTSDFVSRNGAIEGLGSASALGESFSQPAGTIVGPSQAGPVTYVGKIVERQAADMSKLPEQRDSIVTQLKSVKAQQRAVLLQDS